MNKSAPSAGRKPLQHGVETVTLSVRLTPAQRMKVAALGGAAWLRRQIDRAKPPP